MEINCEKDDLSFILVITDWEFRKGESPSFNSDGEPEQLIMLEGHVIPDFYYEDLFAVSAKQFLTIVKLETKNKELFDELCEEYYEEIVKEYYSMKKSDMECFYDN